MRRINNKAVIGNVIKNIEKRIGSRSWLNTALSFNHSLRLKVDHKDKLDFLLRQLGISKRKENFENLNILIANLISKRYRLINKPKKAIMVSLNRTDWKITRYAKAGVSTINIINKLYENGYIELKKGYRTERESKLSRIWATDKLLDYFQKLDHSVIYDPVEVVELSDDNGKLLDYKDSARTRKIRDILMRVNRVNQSANIQFEKYTLHPFLIAIFKRKFTLYGRLHTKGHMHYQGLSSEERKEIIINNDPVVELDFSGLHPHLIYAKEKIQLEDDPYSIVDKRPTVRKFLKQILLCMLNAENELEAERAANYWLYLHEDYRYELYDFGISKARPLMKKFRKAHKRIEHYFCNGKETGLRIMNLDSRIALDIIDHFAKQNIPILSIHDSFIVQAKYEDELRQTMDRIYQKHTNGYKCEIQ